MQEFDNCFLPDLPEPLPICVARARVRARARARESTLQSSYDKNLICSEELASGAAPTSKKPETHDEQKVRWRQFKANRFWHQFGR